MAENKKSFLLYRDILSMVSKMPDEAAGKLFKHILEYVNDCDPEEPEDILVSIAFEPIKQQLKRDLEKYKNIVNRNKANGEKGGRPKAEETQNNPVGLSGFSEEPQKADTDTDTDTDTDKPIIGTNVPIVGKTKTIPDCPHQEIINIYIEKLPTGIIPQTWDGDRATMLRARWRENDKRQDIEWWRRFFEYVSKSDFLTGKVETPGRKIFELNLPWMLKKSNFDKIIDGQYHN